MLLKIYLTWPGFHVPSMDRLSSAGLKKALNITQGNLVKVSTGKIDRLLAEMVGQKSKVDVADSVLDQTELSEFLAMLDQLEEELENYSNMARNAKTQGAHTEGRVSLR